MCRNLLRLVDDRGDHLRVGVPGGVDGDAGGAIEEPVAVHVLDDGALAAGHDEGIVARVRRRHDVRVALDDGLRLGTGKGRLQDWGIHGPIMRLSRLLPLPARALRPVLEDHAAGGQVVADAVGLGEVARRAGRRGGPRSAARSRPPGRAARVLAAAQRQHAEHVVEVRRRPCARRRRRPRRSASASMAVLSVAHQVEHARPARRRCSGRRTAPRRTRRAPSSTARSDLGVRVAARHAVEPGEEVGEAPQRFLRLLHAHPREVELLAVVRREQQVAQRRGAEAALERCRCSV